MLGWIELCWVMIVCVMLVGIRLGRVGLGWVGLGFCLKITITLALHEPIILWVRLIFKLKQV